MIADVAICVDGGRGPSLPPADLYDARQDRGGFTWVGLYEPSEVVFTCVTSGFGPHMLAVKDAIKAHQRPKVDRKDDSVFVVLKWVRYAEGSRLLSTGPATVDRAIRDHGTVRSGQGNERLGGHPRRPDQLHQHLRHALHLHAGSGLEGRAAIRCCLS